MLDIFNSDAFSVTSLTDSIVDVPYVPGQAGTSVDWKENGVSTTTIAIEKKGSVLTLVNPSPRGAPALALPHNKRNMRVLAIPHYEVEDSVYADEVQGVRAFGSETQLETVQGLVNDRLSDMVEMSLEPTLELQRVGAIKGIILNADASTLYNLFTEFGVTPPDDVIFNFNQASPPSGAIRKLCAQVTRTITRALGGLPFTGIKALCSPEFMDALVSLKETRETFLNQQEAAQLRQGYAYGTFVFGGISFEEYRGDIDGVTLIAPGTAQFFPLGVPGLFRTVYAPADYEETVNTVGLPRYAKQIPMQNGKGRTLYAQTNALNYCTRPQVLLKGLAESA